MVLSKSLTAAQMAEVAGCSARSIRAIRSNFRYFGTTRAPSNGVGRRRSITPPMLDALYAARRIFIVCFLFIPVGKQTKPKLLWL
jgi:hypothetical protein